ncbi:PREDICTED: RING-H2 finger protein ATL30-like [Rhagoletis zephyria]|uniref:RING-H2 finger protein ATL30-like n=1 Tax=Rhagoletis zephyria TaxID=28612 RepID=UPI00081125F3|nr:PREDICTED: RING-H2 finger protein ATL30-like [Rhagoletis zephyria]
MTEEQDCVITLCNHVYHRECIGTWLEKQHDCPCCKRLCHVKDWLPITLKQTEQSFQSRQSTNFRGRGHRQLTRNRRRNNTPSSQSLIEGDNNQQAAQSPRSLNLSMPGGDSVDRDVTNLSHTQRNPNNQVRDSGEVVDSDRISQMVEENVKRILAGLNLDQDRFQNQAYIRQSNDPRYLGNSNNINNPNCSNLRTD